MLSRRSANARQRTSAEDGRSIPSFEAPSLNLGGFTAGFDAFAALSPQEFDLLQRFVPANDKTPDVIITISEAPVTSTPAPETHTHLQWEGTTLHLANASFNAILDVAARHAAFYRSTKESWALLLFLRTLATTMLPLFDRLPLHGGAAVNGNEAILFCGVSGAGKTTLANTWQGPLLSDELISLSANSVCGTGFWGDGVVRPPDLPADLPADLPIAALLFPQRADELRLTRLTPSQTLQQTVRSVLVPSGPTFRAALELVRTIVETVPAFRLGWHKDQPPWSEVEAELANRRHQ